MEPAHKTVLRIEGMTCGSCAHHVRTALADLEGVCAVDVRLRDNLATVASDAGGPSLEAMIEAVRQAGYQAAPGQA